jgi:hypothetical protein
MYNEFLMSYVKLMSIVNKHLHLLAVTTFQRSINNFY